MTTVSTNPMVEYLNSLRTQQQSSNSTYIHEARHDFLLSLKREAPWFPDENELYVRTRLDALVDDIVAKETRIRLLFLTGDAGDGKTALCAALARRLGFEGELQWETIIGGWHNLNVSREAIVDLLQDHSWYKLLIPEEELALDSFERTRLWQEIAGALLKKFCERYYAFRKKEWELPHLEYRDLEAGDANFPPGNDEYPDGCYRVFVEESQTDVVSKLKELKALIEAGDLKPWEFAGLRAIWFGQHVYQPLLHLTGSAVEIKPVPLNAGERRFVEDLAAYHKKNPILVNNGELYLLRNMSKGRGVGFFEAGNFHPDFILWQVEGSKQFVSFIDPKGILHLAYADPKIQFYDTIKDIEERLGDPTVILSSFIISNTPAFRMELQWGIPRSEMDEVNILFQDDDPDTYIETMLTRARIV